MGSAENSNSISAQQNDVFSYVTGVYVDDENNGLVVQIRDLDDSKIAEFKAVFPGMDFIEFEEGYNLVPTASWNPGKKILNERGNNLSTGYPVYFTAPNGSRQKGFITAGHAVSKNSKVYNPLSTSSPLALCVNSQFGGPIDAALMQIVDNSYTMSSVTDNGGFTLSSTSYTIPAQNSVVFKDGAKTRVTVGFVESTNYEATFTSSGVKITDMLLTSTLSISGDSGGVMYVNSNGVRSIVGSMSSSICTCGPNEPVTEANFKNSVVCKVGNTLSAFNCTIW